MNKDLVNLLKESEQPFQVVGFPINTQYKVTIDDDFREVYQFSELVSVLEGSNEGDSVLIKLSTNGGALHSIIPLINAMQNTRAQTFLHVESDTASAGTALMMLADEVYVNEFVSVMIHTANYGYFGHSGNMDAHVKHSTKAIEKFVRETYVDFLSEAEILRVLDGKEIYMDADECHERFAKRDKIRAERHAKEQQALQEKAAKKTVKKKVVKEAETA